MATTTRKVGPHVHSITSNGDDKNVCSSFTFDHQSELRKLPIPSLEETMSKFPKVVQALQTEEQQKETQRLCQEFLESPGPELQRELEKYAKEGVSSGSHGSYIEEFWNESYLAPDSSVVLNLNPYFVLEASPDPKLTGSQLGRASSLCFAAIKFASMLKDENLRPDTTRGGQPLCMDQFKVLFGASRQPSNRDACDSVSVYNDSTHVAVLCHNQFYYFPALWPDTRHVAVDEGDIKDILSAIERHASKKDKQSSTAEALGGLTSLPRSEWAEVREELCKNEANTAALHLVDSALFVLVLDDVAAADDHSIAGNMLHGTNALDENDVQIGSCLNRWYDKLQLIVCRDGSAGVNFEHSAIDGHTALRFVSDIFAETVITFAESITALVHGKGHIPHVVRATVKRAAAMKGDEVLDVFPKKIIFHLSEFVLKRIRFAETALADQICSSDTRVLNFADYGKLLIVANKLSPDSMIQMSMHLAYFDLYGKFVCGYEPVLTKGFFHGRTEAMRSATPEAKELCRIWNDKSSSDQAKLEALRVATKEHSRLVKESSQGKGVDRHLFALKSLAKRQGKPIPALFESQGWRCLSHTVLSTSNCGNPALKMFGFGPVVQDGFGLGYIIKDNGITYSIASKHRQTARFAKTLERVLRELKSLLKPISEVEVQSRPSLQEASKTISSGSNDAYDDIYGESVAGSEGISLPVTDRRPSCGSQLFSSVLERTKSLKLLGLSDIRIDLELSGEERKGDK